MSSSKEAESIEGSSENPESTTATQGKESSRHSSSEEEEIIIPLVSQYQKMIAPVEFKKKFDLKDAIDVDRFIDAKDSVNNWCLAKIVKVVEADSSLEVRFDGWSYRYNEVTLHLLIS